MSAARQRSSPTGPHCRRPKTSAAPLTTPVATIRADALLPQEPLRLVSGPVPLHLLDALTPTELERERAEAYEQLREWAFRLDAVVATQHPEWTASHVHAESLRAVATLYAIGELAPTPAHAKELPACPA